MHSAVLMELSLSRATLITPKPMEKEARVVLYLELEGQKQYPVQGKVKWSSAMKVAPPKHPFPSNYIQEVEFLQIPQEIAKIIRAYVSARLQAETQKAAPEFSSEIVNRRKYLRTPCTLTIVSRDRRNTPFSITTKDLSIGGTHFTTSQPIVPGESITLQLQLDIASPPLNAAGKIMWVKKMEDGNFEGGLVFQNLSKEAWRILPKFLGTLLSTQTETSEEE